MATLYEEARSAQPLCSVNELAAYLSVSRATVYRMIRAGELRPVKIGHRLRFRAEDVEALTRAAAVP